MPLNEEAQGIVDRIDRAFHTFGKVFNQDAVIDAMREHYAALGVPMPEVVVIKNMEEAFKKAASAARDASWDASWGASWDAAQAARDAARDASWDASWDAAWDAAWGASWDAAQAARDAARDASWDASWGAAWDAARGAAAAANSGLTDPATLKFKAIEAPFLRALENGLGFYFPMRDQLILVPVPAMQVNEQMRPHSDSTSAITWQDGTGYHFLNGVRFPEGLWKEVVSGEMPFEKILAIEDIDQRTQAMRFGDVNDFLKHAKAKLLDSKIKKDIHGEAVVYQLYKIPKGDIFQETAYYVKYMDPSTKKTYMSGVEPCKTVSEAMAWKSQITTEQWESMVPLLQEA